MKQTFANVIIDISHEKVDRTFQYMVPEPLKDKIRAGVQVEIPFGKGNSLRRGFVVEVTEKPEFDIDRMKEIAGISPDRVSVQSQLIELAWEMKRIYGSTMNQALKTVLPVKQKMKRREKKTVRCRLTREELAEALKEARRRSYRARIRLFEAFLETEQIPGEVVEHQLNITAASLKPLVESGAVEVARREVYRDPLKGLQKEAAQVKLNADQQAAADTFWDSYKERLIQGPEGQKRLSRDRTWLLHGITGSGKTEVYMEMMDRVLREGRQVIVLIPEIALTFQTVLRFYNHFGERVSILNSRMSPGERSDQFERAKRGLLDVMIGPRSALFTPFPNLGVIIIDEEHEAAYKSETVPRYHARETAIARGMLCGAHVVLGSATPSVESYDRAQQGQYRLFEMKERVSARPLPTVYTVDLREELRNGNRSILSDRLRKLMTDRLEKKEQIMLFLNRRGVAGFVSCRSCGEVIKCPHCDVSLNLHNDGKLVCHYCGYQQPMVKKCPSCGSSYVGGFKAGTQKIEQYVRQQFPSARVLRMDLDTTRKKGGYESILSAFSNQEADILIGTQMIVKGHDFPNVTLVGILAADLSLHISDYRAPERTFQLLTQAAGRAGRGCRQGEVVIQTYQPEHYSIVTAAAQDYEAFFQQEIFFREMLHYPPKWHMLVVHAASEKEMLVKQAQDMLKYKLLTKMEKEKEHLQIIGPADAAVSRINDIFRKVLYVKAEDYQLLVHAKNMLEQEIRKDPAFRAVTIQFDFDPMNGF